MSPWRWPTRVSELGSQTGDGSRSRPWYLGFTRAKTWIYGCSSQQNWHFWRFWPTKCVFVRNVFGDLRILPWKKPWTPWNFKGDVWTEHTKWGLQLIGFCWYITANSCGYFFSFLQLNRSAETKITGLLHRCIEAWDLAIQWSHFCCIHSIYVYTPHIYTILYIYIYMYIYI